MFTDPAVVDLVTGLLIGTGTLICYGLQQGTEGATAMNRLTAILAAIGAAIAAVFSAFIAGSRSTATQARRGAGRET